MSYQAYSSKIIVQGYPQYQMQTMRKTVYLPEHASQYMSQGFANQMGHAQASSSMQISQNKFHIPVDNLPSGNEESKKSKYPSKIIKFDRSDS